MKTLAKELLKCISAIRNDVHKRRILKACWPCVLKPRKRLEEHQNPFCPPTLTAASLHWEMTFHHSLRATNHHNWSCFWNHRVCGTEAENNRESSTSGRRKEGGRGTISLAHNIQQLVLFHLYTHGSWVTMNNGSVQTALWDVSRSGQAIRDLTTVREEGRSARSIRML